MTDNDDANQLGSSAPETAAVGSAATATPGKHTLTSPSASTAPGVPGKRTRLPQRPRNAGAPAAAASAFLGAPIALPYLAELERAFGVRLGHVEAYTDEHARRATEGLGAPAFAFGHQIAFASPSPSIELVAHEVAHTIQQGGGAAAVQAKGTGPGDAYEREADLAAAAVASGGTAAVALRTDRSIQRFGGAAGDLVRVLTEAGASRLLTHTYIADDVELGRIWQWIAPFVAPGIHVDPTARVSAFYDPRTEDILIESKALRAPQIELGTLHARDVLLSGVSISGNRTSQSGSMQVKRIHMASPTFATAKGTIGARSLDLQDLRVGGKMSGAGIASIAQLDVAALAYPGVPPITFAMADVQCVLGQLSSLVTSSGASKDANKDASKDAHAGSLAASLPEGSSVFIQVEGADTVVTAGDRTGRASLAHGKVELRRGDHELAKIELRNFKAGATKDKAGGTIGSLVVHGAPELVHALLEAPELHTAPHLADAMALIKSLGLTPALDGTLALENVSAAATGGAIAVAGDLHASFDQPELGRLSVDLVGFHGDHDAGALGARFQRFAATLTARDGSTAGLTVAAPEGVDATAGVTTVAPMTFAVTGHAEHVDQLVAGLTRALVRMPPQVRAAVELVKSLGMEVSGTIAATAGRDGKTAIAGDVHAKVDVANLGALTLDVVGFSGGDRPALGSVQFAHFDAALHDAGGHETAFLSLDNAPGSKDVGGAFVARGHTSALTTALAQHARALPPQVTSVLEVLRTYGFGGAATGRIGIHTVGDHVVAHGSVSTRVAAAGIGVVAIDADNVTAAVGGAALGVGFDRLQVSLRDPQGRAAAGIQIDRGRNQGAQAATADQIRVTGDADGMRHLMAALSAHVAALPPVVHDLVELARTHALSAGGTFTLSHVAVTDRNGKLDAAADVDAAFAVSGLGKVTVKATQLRGQASGGDVTGAELERLVATLTDEHGTPIASISARGLAKGSHRAGGDLAFTLDGLEVSGSSAQLDALLAAIEQQKVALPASLRSALAAVRGLGVDVTGTVSLDGAALARKNGRTEASGNLAVHLEVPHVGAIDVDLIGFAASVGGARDAPQAAHFQRLDAALTPADGGKPAVKLVIDGVDASATGATARDAGLHVGKITVEGDAAQLAALLRGIEERIAGLPEPMHRTFAAVRRYLPDAGDATITVTGADVQRTDGRLAVGGDVSASFAVPGAGTVIASTSGFRLGADGGGGFRELAVTLEDQPGRPAASLRVEDVAGSRDPKARVTVGSIRAEGDGKRLAVALDAAAHHRLPQPILDALAMVRSVGVGVTGVVVDDGGARAAQIDVTGDVDVTTTTGGVYHARNAKLSIHAPTTTTGPHGRPRSITSDEIDVSGTFVMGGTSVTGSIKLASAHLACDDDGRPVSVDAVHITSDLGGVLDAAPRSSAGGAGAKAARPFVPLVKDVDVDLTTPVHHGAWGAIHVRPGTLLHTTLQVRDHAIVARRTRAVFAPPLGLPAWFKTAGAHLDADGSGFDVVVDMRGFFDVNVTWLARLFGVMGKERLQLDLRRLFDQLLEMPQRGAAAAESAHAKPPARGANADADRLRAEHDIWQRHRDGDDVADELTDEPMSRHEKDLFTPKGFDVARSRGLVDLRLANESAQPAALSDTVTIPAGASTHLHGAIDGAGEVVLGVDDLAGVVRGQHVELRGVTGGGALTGSNRAIASVGIAQVHWDAGR